MNELVVEKDKGILSPYFQIHLFPAWDEKRKSYKSLWNAKYPGKTEAEFWANVKPKDEVDKAGNFQQRPIKKSGLIFPATNYHERKPGDEFPKDLKLVFYTDPNCALKAKGDTTSEIILGWSSSMQKFFVPGVRCKSYWDSNELLLDFLKLKKEIEEKTKARVLVSRFDGNVTQESTWSNNILQFTRIHGFPFPRIEFVRYKVDELAAPVEAEWKADKFLFEPGFSETEEGAEFLKQTFGFKTKKAAKKDDGPDTLICAYQTLVELGYVSAIGLSTEFVSVSNRQIKRL